MGITGVITHPRPHLDEIVAMFLLQFFGEEKYPGIGDVILNKKILTMRIRGGEEAARRYESRGFILLGVGGGLYDEHGIDGDRKEGDCCASLVAKDLGIEKRPGLAKILRFVTVGDLNGNSNPFDIAAMVDLINAQNPSEPATAIDFAFTALSAKYAEQYDFHYVAKEQFEKATKEEFVTADGQKLRIVSLTTDNETVIKYAREKGVDIVIKKNTSGQVQIFTNKKSNLDLTDTAQILRFVEQEERGTIVTSDWKILASEGQVDGAEEWYFFPKGKMILNGSLTAPNTPPTRIPLLVIRKLVQIGVGGMFEPSRAEKCLQSICTSTRKNECKWYPFGLKRCRAVRFAQSQK